MRPGLRVGSGLGRNGDGFPFVTTEVVHGFLGDGLVCRCGVRACHDGFTFVPCEYLTDGTALRQHLRRFGVSLREEAKVRTRSASQEDSNLILQRRRVEHQDDRGDERLRPCLERRRGFELLERLELGASDDAFLRSVFHPGKTDDVHLE